MTRYGYSTIAIVSIIVFILFTAGIFINNQYAKYLLFAAGAFLLVFTINFFRDPERIPPKKKNVVVSPADGTVLAIKQVECNKFIEGKATQISIFMSPLNVHVNRIPVDGTIDYANYIKGEYLVASHDKADERNERSEFGITSDIGKIFFTQVAGFVARRIVFDLKKGDAVKMGERFGMIKFGSRVDVVAPAKFKVMVGKGDKTTAGETILFQCEKK
jgi:phosphatidylserine decarboxylase